jgi:hypothetical protein
VLPGDKKILEGANPIWIKSPTAADLAAQFPKAAVGKAVVGHVVLHCVVEKSGDLRECAVHQEIPTRLGFGRAAQQLSKGFQVDMAEFHGVYADEIQVDLPVHFMDPASDDWKNRSAAKPRWLAGPTMGDVATAFPVTARTAGIKTGLGRIDCLIAPGGKLADCRIADDVSKTSGFGEAALKLSSTFAMNPWTDEGLPADGIRVTMPVRLVDDPAPAPATGR